MKPFPGTYALVLRSQQSASAQIGRWGRLNIRPGYYIYVGSAFGPGGVRSRVSRHCREAKSKHWHIDYLREFASPVAVWCSYDTAHLEHRWAKALNNLGDTTPVEGFGCTDCQCEAHLFFTTKEPELVAFSAAVDSGVESCFCE